MEKGEAKQFVSPLHGGKNTGTSIKVDVTSPSPRKEAVDETVNITTCSIESPGLDLDDEDWEEATVHGSEPPEAVTPESLNKGTEEADSSPVTQEQVQHTGEAAFGSVIPDIDAPLTISHDFLPASKLETHPNRTASLDVEAGSLAKLEQESASGQDSASDALSAKKSAVVIEATPSSSSIASEEEGSVVVHSTPESTPQAAKPDGLKEDSPAGSDADVPSVDFTAGVAEEPLSAPKGPDSEGSQQMPRKVVDSRPGVTASPPRSPKRDLPVQAASNLAAEPPGGQQASEPLSANGSRQDAASVADDLAEAEAQAEVAALAASQRNSSLGKKAAKEATSPDDAATFTEEALQSDDRETTPSPIQQVPAARPFSPPPGAAKAKMEDAGGEAFEPPEFRGLVFHDGVDALGRPVIVVNADAVSSKVPRRAACAYMLQRLEPIVIQGPYVLVLLNTGNTSRSNKLPAGWLAASYREMSYPFKKNVKHVILVRPSATLNFMLAIMRPLISRKAFVKLKKVENLTAIAEATNSEVTLQHLGPKFAASAGQAIVAGENLGRRGGYQMPSF